MDGHSVSLAAQAALEKLPRHEDGRIAARPDIRSDNGSGYISREFGLVLDQYELSHRKITPHCPEENGIIGWYNDERLHSALGFLRPVDYYRGCPEEMHEARRQKLAAARCRRKEINLQFRQPTLPLETGRLSLNSTPKMSHYG